MIEFHWIIWESQIQVSLPCIEIYSLSFCLCVFLFSFVFPSLPSFLFFPFFLLFFQLLFKKFSVKLHWSPTHTFYILWWAHYISIIIICLSIYILYHQKEEILQDSKFLGNQLTTNRRIGFQRVICKRVFGATISNYIIFFFTLNSNVKLLLLLNQCETDSMWAMMIPFWTLWLESLVSFPQAHTLILISGKKKFFSLRSRTKLVHSSSPRTSRSWKGLWTTKHHS